jgi:hypothetical protein
MCYFSVTPDIRSNEFCIRGGYFTASSVSNLFSARGPTTIVGFIVSVWIYSIKATAGWTFAHVGKKVFKPMPAVANGNSAPAVVDKGLVSWNAASLQHSCPRRVGLGPSSYRVSMPEEASRRSFGSETTARYRAAANNVVLVYYFLVAAFAMKQPSWMTDFFDGDQSPETVTGDIYRLGHRSAPAVRGQVAGSMLNTSTRCAI